MTSTTGTILVLATFVAAAVLTRVVQDVARARHLLDKPNTRSSHTVPRPRLGGLGIVPPFVVAGGVLAAALGGLGPTAAVLAGTAAISVLGFVDDLRPIAARWRFLIQALVAVAVVLVTGGAAAGSPWLAFAPTPIPQLFLVLWIVWLTNLYNFMDGIDGLAGGQAAVAGFAIAAAAFATGADLTGWLALVLAAANAGFLLFNFPPSTIFMGDVGSTAIGFFFACTPLLPERHPVALETVGLALSFFILDATVTLVWRIARGEKWFEAHRTHFYQRPVALGFSHRSVTVVAYGGMVLVGAGAAAYPGANVPERLVLLAAAGVVFVVLAMAVLRLERRALRLARRAHEQRIHHAC
jgi:glycosyltransferase WbpL